MQTHPDNTGDISAAWQILWNRHSKEQKTLNRLQHKIGYVFKNIHFLYEALTHRSALRKKEIPAILSKNLCWNERVEFLGDSVLSLSISSYLWQLKPPYSEGQLSKIRAYLVSEKTLSKIARDFGLGHSIILGPGEEKAGGRNRDALLADSMEALIGAVYLDGGSEQARNVVMILFDQTLTLPLDTVSRDFKSILQEWCQAQFRTTPTYRLVSESGPDHAKKFVVAVYVDSLLLAFGRGFSKKLSSQYAAQCALVLLEQILGTDMMKTPVTFHQLVHLYKQKYE